MAKPSIKNSAVEASRVRRPLFTERLLLRITDEQKETYIRAAVKVNMDLSQWIRCACDTAAAESDERADGKARKALGAVII